jgi:hypothetical protein
LPLWFRKPLSFRLTKNWAVALWGSPVRAMAMVPRSLVRPLSASFWIGDRVVFCRCWASKPPPWIMKLGMTRWNRVPSKKPADT